MLDISSLRRIPPLAFLFAFVACGNVARSHGQDVRLSEDATDNRSGQVVQLKVTPAAEPVPAFRYRLTTPPHQTIPGNAATHYLRSFGENSLAGPWQTLAEKFGDELHEWYRLETPTADIPWEKARAASEAFDHYVDHLLRRASRCRVCDWGLAEEDLSGMETVEFLLPSVQQTRTISRVLALRTRVALHDRAFDRAIDHLRMNYQLGHDVSQMKFLVCDLVGIAETGIAHQGMLELIATPGSPNMYWALAELPDPLIDIRDSVRLEMSVAIRLIPELKDVDQAEHTPEEWNRLLTSFVTSVHRANQLLQSPGGEGGPQKDWQANLHAAGLLTLGYPGARARLKDMGYPDEQLARMPAAQVVLLDVVRDYTRLANEFEKSLYVAPHQIPAVARQAEHRLAEQAGPTRMGQVLANMLLPAIQNVRQAQMRVDWQRRALMALEALRMYAAEHGRFPQSLDDVTQAPVPLDPLTQQPFEYEWNDGTAIIRTSQAVPQNAWLRIEATLTEPTAEDAK